MLQHSYGTVTRKKKNKNNDLVVAHPHSDSLSTIPGWNRNLKVLVFEEKGKPEYPKKNLSEQRREPTTNCGQPTYDIGA